MGRRQKHPGTIEFVEHNQEQFLRGLQEVDQKEGIDVFQKMIDRRNGDIVTAADEFDVLFSSDRIGLAPDQDAFLWRVSEALDPSNINAVQSVCNTNRPLISNRYGERLAEQFLIFTDEHPDQAEVVGANFGEIALELKLSQLGSAKFALKSIKDVLTLAQEDSSQVIPGINGSAEYAAQVALQAYKIPTQL